MGASRRRVVRLGLAALVTLALGLVAVALVRSSAPEVYETEDLRFSLPSGWERIEGVRFPLAEGKVFGEGFGDDVVGLDRGNWIMVVARESTVLIDSTNVGSLVPTFRAMVEDIAMVLPDPYEVVRPPSVIEEAGLPGVRFVIRGKGVRERPFLSVVTQLFAGRRYFVINCQSEGARRRAVKAGCDRVLSSFEPVR